MLRLLPALVFALILTCTQGQPHYTEQGPRPPVLEVCRGVDRVFVVEATAYCYTGNQTKTGTWPEAGRSIAVDPAVIPLGSRVWVEGHGYRVAEDTGWLIRWNKIDIYMGSDAEAIRFGRREVRVVVRE